MAATRNLRWSSRKNILFFHRRYLTATVKHLVEKAYTSRSIIIHILETNTVYFLSVLKKANQKMVYQCIHSIQ